MESTHQFVHLYQHLCSLNVVYVERRYLCETSIINLGFEKDLLPSQDSNLQPSSKQLSSHLKEARDKGALLASFQNFYCQCNHSKKLLPTARDTFLQCLPIGSADGKKKHQFPLAMVRLVIKEHIIRDRLIKEKHTNVLLPVLCDMEAFRHGGPKKRNTLCVGLGLVRSGGGGRRGSVPGQRECELMLIKEANSASLSVQILLGVSVSLRVNMFLSCQDEKGTLRNKSFMTRFIG